MTDYSFNLVDEPWISCAGLDEKLKTLGIRDVFLQAHELRSIQHQNPLTEAAVLRVLMAVVHRAVNGPKDRNEWKALYQTGKFNGRINEYLAKWSHRFDLFSKDAPFYQTPGLAVVDKDEKPAPQSIASIMIGIADGNNKTLFDHTTSSTPVSVPPAEAANTLITSQMFSLNGLNRKITNLFGYQFRFEESLMVQGIFIILTGRSLFETLMLNLLIYDGDKPIPNTAKDRPVWERTDIGKAITNKDKPIPPNGYLDCLTCKSRHILLVPNEKESEIFVKDIHIAQGERFVQFTNPGLMNKKSKKGTYYHPSLDVDRLLWRDSAALFSFDDHSDNRPKAFNQAQIMRSVVDLPDRYFCTAFALANKDANPLAWRKEKLNIPLSLLSDVNIVAYLEKGMDLTSRGEKVLYEAVKTFLREYLPKNSKDVVEKAKATGAATMYWDQLERHFHKFLIDLDDPETAIEAWEKAIKYTARDSLETCVYGRYRSAFKAWSIASFQLNWSLKTLHE